MFAPKTESIRANHAPSKGAAPSRAPSSRPGRINAAIERAQALLLSTQEPDGHWVGELEADSTITSEYLLFGRLMDRVDREREAKIVTYLRAQQLADGGWSLYEGGPASLSATIKAYFSMKLAGVSPEDPAMVRARALIHQLGGPVQANVFTKILLAQFGEYDWSGIPAMPVEIMLLPRWSYFNLLEVSYWSRAVIVPLLILMDAKPVMRLPDSARLDELWVVPRERASLRFHRVPRPFSPKTFLWKNFFIGVDDALKGWERLGPRPLRTRALDAARRWVEERLAVPGGLGGIFPAMVNAVLALRCLGYAEDHPLIRGQLKEIEALGVETTTSLHYQPCVSPVWDTALAVNALIESGLPADHHSLVRAGEWMIDKQITVPGDWTTKRPGVPPGGWPFQYHNDFYPDLDDSAMVMMALSRTEGLDAERRRRALTRGMAWFLGMQGSDGGWASFDADNNRLILNNIPFADHGALLDPSTEDLTGRGPRAPGHAGRARSTIPPPGARWTTSAAISTRTGRGTAAGARTTSTAPGRYSAGCAPWARTARGSTWAARWRWLEARQNADGGWGETLASYEDPAWAGRGESIPSQTAWALLGLFAAGRTDRPRGGARHPVPPRHAERGGGVGGSALERHRVSRVSSISSTTCTPSTSPSGRWGSIGPRADDGAGAAAPRCCRSA